MPPQTLRRHHLRAHSTKKSRPPVAASVFGSSSASDTSPPKRSRNHGPCTQTTRRSPPTPGHAAARTICLPMRRSQLRSEGRPELFGLDGPFILLRDCPAFRRIVARYFAKGKQPARLPSHLTAADKMIRYREIKAVASHANDPHHASSRTGVVAASPGFNNLGRRMDSDQLANLPLASPGGHPVTSGKWQVVDLQ